MALRTQEASPSSSAQASEVTVSRLVVAQANGRRAEFKNVRSFVLDPSWDASTAERKAREFVQRQSPQTLATDLVLIRTSDGLAAMYGPNLRDLDVGAQVTVGLKGEVLSVVPGPGEALKWSLRATAMIAQRRLSDSVSGVLVWLVLCGLSACSAAGVPCPSSDCPGDEAARCERAHQRRDAIIGGAPTNEYPSVFQLRIGGKSECTATRISTRTLLTAAHCWKGTPRFPPITASNAATNEEVSPSNSWAVELFEPHPSYRPEADVYRTDPQGRVYIRPDGSIVGDIEEANDLAFVLLSDAPPGPLHTLERQPLTSADVGRPVRFVGYGVSSSGGRDPGTKRLVDVPVELVTEFSFWTGTKSENSKNPCKGDSGGPAFVQTGDGASILGVVRSFDPRYPDCSFGRMTRVDRYARFIDSWLEEKDPLPVQGCAVSGGPASGLLVVGLLLGRALLQRPARRLSAE